MSAADLAAMPGKGMLCSPVFVEESATYIRTHADEVRNEIVEARGYLMEMIFDDLDVIARGKLGDKIVSLLHCLHIAEQASNVILGAADDLEAHRAATKKKAPSR
jgi:hypothetical protein